MTDLVVLTSRGTLVQLNTFNSPVGIGVISHKSLHEHILINPFTMPQMYIDVCGPFARKVMQKMLQDHEQWGLSSLSQHACVQTYLSPNLVSPSPKSLEGRALLRKTLPVASSTCRTVDCPYMPAWHQAFFHLSLRIMAGVGAAQQLRRHRKPRPYEDM
jgi:hypothetical protein